MSLSQSVGVCETYLLIFYGGVVVTADNMDEWLKVDGLSITCFGVACDALVDVDQINDGDVDDEIEMA
jgi:hypothetical protein